MAPRPILQAVLAALLTAAVLAPQAPRAEPSLEEKKAAAYGMYADYRRSFPDVPDIHPLEAMRLMALGRVVFVDTREDDEMAISTLPGAVSRDVFLSDPGRFGDRQVVVYCTISYRSGRFAREMAGRGLDLTNLRGGLLAWVLEGGKVVDRQGETHRIHVYGKKWDIAPKGYRTVTFPVWKQWLRK